MVILNSEREVEAVTMVSVRKATLADAEAIAHVAIDTWRSTYQGIVPDEHLAKLSYELSQRMWEKTFSDAKTFIFVAEDTDGQVVGYANGGPVRDAEEEYMGELYGIYVRQAVQGKGIGRMLCREVAKLLKSEGLDSMLVWVLAQNTFRQFYERLGGKHVRTRDITIGGKVLTEWGYGWKGLDFLT